MKSREERAAGRLTRIRQFLSLQRKCPEPFKMTVAEQAQHVRHLAEQAYQIVMGRDQEGTGGGEADGL